MEGGGGREGGGKFCYLKKKNRFFKIEDSIKKCNIFLI